MRAAIVESGIDPGALIAEVSAETNGAVSVFLGTVRSTNNDRDVGGIEYSAYSQMAESEMNTILGEAATRFGIEHAVIEHRIGMLRVGDVSIAVVVAAPHRAPALDATRYIVDETKMRAPIWKLELYTDGAREWVGAGARG
jgi:molybdopterin synthase catalytic subunit